MHHAATPPSHARARSLSLAYLLTLLYETQMSNSPPLSGQTVVEGTYDGAGKLHNFTVTLAARQKDVEFAGCVKEIVN